ncbi:hypothetical protein [Gorillibacterium sp. sgz500922]|uniref:hypothetical protein n=1 Tax=Gorillibacterium sp. sgz500922 TaxID=3446694 RepID=UPI003F662C1F
MKKIHHCEECKWAVLNFCYTHLDDREVGEAILTSIHEIELDYRTELLHLRLEKSLQARKLQKEQPFDTQN